MSMSVEFFAAEPQELIEIFSRLVAGEDDDTLFERLEAYPHAEFPGRLLLPDDLDTLCSIIRSYHPQVPERFQENCVEEIWNDGTGAESLTLLSEQFVGAVAAFSDGDIHRVALCWTWGFMWGFSQEEPVSESLPYRAVVQLRAAARESVLSAKPLVFHLDGAPGFFEYLRYL